ncbi:MAG: hypothetical protein KDC54_20965, partial [Lewinella sp.]|nr:hypothetical protein [Lewinella sp.]
MFHLKNLMFVMVAASMLACSNGSTQATTDQSATAEQVTGADTLMDGDDAEAIQALMQRSMEGIEVTKYHEYIDPNNGLVQARYPIPQSWHVNSTDNPIYIEGPNNLVVHKAETQNFMWSNDPMMQQTLQMGGQNLAQPMSNRQILAQFVRPNAESQGYRFQTSYELPEVAGFWQRIFHAMVNTGSQNQVEALGTEWLTSSGTKSLILMVRWQSVKDGLVYWNIQTSELETAPGDFEKARNAYCYSYANAQLNPQWMQYMNGQLRENIRSSNEFWANASRQSAAAHQQRMSAIAARGNAARSVGDTYSDILDISHQGYLTRSNINDAGHEATIRSINETTLIGNHETGERYSVPAGSNYYWVSGDG